MHTFVLLSEAGLIPKTILSPTLLAARPILQALNKSLGYSVFETVNQMSNEGRMSEHVTHLRALYADFDEGLPAAFPLPPTRLVLSSPGKYQAYWTFEEPLPATPETRAEYLGVEASLVEMLHADDKAKDIARILRVSGFINHKLKYAPNFPVVVDVHRADGGQQYTLERLRSAFGFKAVATESFDQGRGLAARTGEGKAVAAFKKAIANRPPPATQRNQWLYSTACFGLVQLGLSEDTVYEVLEEAVQDVEDLRRTVHNANKYAMRLSMDKSSEVEL